MAKINVVATIDTETGELVVHRTDVAGGTELLTINNIILRKALLETLGGGDKVVL